MQFMQLHTYLFVTIVWGDNFDVDTHFCIAKNLFQLRKLYFFKDQIFKVCPTKQQVIRHGLGVRIAGSHPAGPGSIPGVGIIFLCFKPALAK